MAKPKTPPPVSAAPEPDVQAAAVDAGIPVQAPEDAAGATAASPSDHSPPAPAPVIVKATVIVTGPKSGRRRIGRTFGPAPMEIAAEDLTDSELAALIADPELSVIVPDSAH